jgi:hypothetical protein
MKEKSPTRKIVSDDRDFQIQEDDDGYRYHYRKDYISYGNGKTEYSLSLMYAKKITSVGESHGYFVEPSAVRESSESAIPVQPGNGDTDVRGRGEVHDAGSDNDSEIPK